MDRIEKIKEILKCNNKIMFAYLFGSAAQNKVRFGSDLDIGVYFEQMPVLLEIGAIVNELEEALGFTIDLVLLNHLYEDNPKLAYSVLSKGNLLFCLDEKLLTRYKEKTYLRYLDIKPVIDLFDRKLEERIKNKKFAVVEK